MTPEQKHSQLMDRVKVMIDDLKYSDPEGYEEGEQASEMLDLLEEAEELGNSIWGEGFHEEIRAKRKKHGNQWSLYETYFP